MFKLDYATGIKTGFQNAASPIGEGIQELHNKIFSWLLIIFVLVLIIFSVIYKETIIDNEKPSRENLNRFKKMYLPENSIVHGTILEIIWTVTPSIILVMIAIPSFALLYSIDEIIDPDETVKVIGNQWHRTYEQLKTKWKLSIPHVNVTYDWAMRQENLTWTFLDMTVRVDKINTYTEPFGLIIESPIKTIKSFSHTRGDGEFFTPAIKFNKVSADYVSFDSYMVPESELSVGDLRLLEVDNPLVLGVKKHIRFIITASDVLHSFGVPSLGIKLDGVPGRLNEIATYIRREGVYYGQCSESCGVNHGYMPIKIVALKL